MLNEAKRIGNNNNSMRIPDMRRIHSTIVEGSTEGISTNDSPNALNRIYVETTDSIRLDEKFPSTIIDNNSIDNNNSNTNNNNNSNNI